MGTAIIVGAGIGGIATTARLAKAGYAVTVFERNPSRRFSGITQFGLSHNVLQVGYLRHHNRHKQYKNLYFAGASTHPGTGLPIVLLSAKLIEERILKEQPKP